ncbi:MAG: hypothetical protein M5U08_19980 [Burkholderiales bacterium]|nr:hypothetical protein [Burkholderiales bacterium]
MAASSDSRARLCASALAKTSARAAIRATSASGQSRSRRSEPNASMPSTRPATFIGIPRCERTPTRRNDALSTSPPAGNSSMRGHDHGVAGAHARKYPRKPGRDRLRPDHRHAVDGPGMRDVRPTGRGRELDELAPVHVEKQHDLPQRIRDRAIDLGREQVDEARRQVGQEPLELQELLLRGRASRGTALNFRVEHRDVEKRISFAPSALAGILTCVSCCHYACCWRRR